MMYLLGITYLRRCAMHRRTKRAKSPGERRQEMLGFLDNLSKRDAVAEVRRDTRRRRVHPVEMMLRAGVISERDLAEYERLRDFDEPIFGEEWSLHLATCVPAAAKLIRHYRPAEYARLTAKRRICRYESCTKPLKAKRAEAQGREG